MIASIFQCANDDHIESYHYPTLDYVVISIPNSCDFILPDAWHPENKDDTLVDSYFSYLIIV
jgi:hypothetical protein